MGRLSLSVLGGFRLRLAADAPVLIPSKKAQALLTYLALQPSQPHFRDKLATLLWSEMAQRQARHGLRQTLVSLRRVFAKTRTRALVIEGDTVALDRSALDVDVVAFEQLARRGTRPSLAEAVDLYRGDLLDGLSVREAPFDEWLLTERARIRELALEALTKLLAAHMKSRADEAAIQAASRLLTFDPFQEAGHRALMRVYARQGRRGSALRQYQACVSLLQRELGAEPERETKQLYQQMLQRPVGTSTSTPPAGPKAGRTPEARFPMAPSALPDRSSPLIGREAEMTVLRRSLKDAVRGRGQVLFLTGEAGIGKTRLIVELAGEAAGQGARILLARAHESEVVFPFATWREAFRSGQVVSDTALLDGLDVCWRKELARLFPDIKSPEPTAPSIADGSLRLCEAMIAAITHLASQRPLVVILEDLHWADEMTVRLLSFVGRRIATHRVLMVGTFRDEALADAPAVRRLLEELERDRQHARLNLAPLTQSEAASLVRTLARAGRDDARISELGERLWKDSDGNPFVIVETMRALEDHRLPGDSDGLALPPRVREVIAARLDRLSPRSQELAAVAAVAGRDVSFALLQRAAGLTPRETAASVEELVRRRVFDDLGDRFDFVHDRVRDVVYGALLRPRRMVLHAAVGEALEVLHADRLDDLHDRLAYHFSQADEPAKATRYLVHLADRAVRTYALDDSVRILQAALGHTDRLPGEARDRGHLQVVFRLAHVLSLLGRNQDILDLLRKAGPCLERLDDAVLAQYHFWLGHCYGNFGDPKRAQDHAQQALGHATRAGDTVTAGKAHFVLAREYYYLARPFEGAEHGRQAVTLLTGTEEPWWLGQAWWYVGFNLNHIGEYPAALEAFARLRDIGVALGDVALEADALWATGWIRALCGDREAGTALLRRGVAMAPTPLAKAKAVGFLGAAFLEAGKPGEAIVHLEEALQHLKVFTTSGPSRYSQLAGFFGALLAESHLHERDLERARERATLALELTTDAGWGIGISYAERALGRIALAIGDLDVAEAHLTRALDTSTSIDARFAGARARLDLAEVRHRRGDRGAALAYLTEARATFHRLGVPMWVGRAEALARELDVTLELRRD